MTIYDTLGERFRTLPPPKNYYRGVRLPDGFELPDEILLFYHDFCAPAPNAHNRYTVVFPLAEMTYYVDQKRYFLREGDILFIRPYSLRFMTPGSAGYRRLFITFQLKEEQPYLPESNPCRLREGSELLLRRILDCYETGDGIALAMALYELLRTLTPDTGGRHVTDKQVISGRIAETLEFINDNPHRRLDIRQIAKKVNMSASNIALRFRAEVGMPIHKYILHQRLEFARYYLRETGMRLDEIAQHCGFGSASSFSHFFKSGTGMSPLAWRKLNRKKGVSASR